MITLDVKNPFNAPVYHEETVDSTMNISRNLAQKGEPHGTVITSDFQEKGRGRICGRVWQMDRDVSLPFTILLRYKCIEEIPKALTLRAGLAVTLAIEDFTDTLQGNVKVKWPNDIIINEKKAGGILCETDGKNVFIGIGINFAQKEFAFELKEKATSISIAAQRDFLPLTRFDLLETILSRLYSELQTCEDDNWNQRLQTRLFKKDENVIFIEGAADSGEKIKGRLSGIGNDGGLLIIPEGKTEACSFITGELVLF